MIPDELLKFADEYVPPEPVEPPMGARFPGAPVVKELFAKSRMPIKQLARLAGIHPESVSLYCAGRRDPDVYFFDYLVQAAGYQLTLRSKYDAPR